MWTSCKSSDAAAWHKTTTTTLQPFYNSHATRFQQINYFYYFYYLPRETLCKSITSFLCPWHFSTPVLPSPFPSVPILVPGFLPNLNLHPCPPFSISFTLSSFPPSHTLTKDLPQLIQALYGGERWQSLQEYVHMWNVKYWNCTIKDTVWSPTLMLFLMLLMLLSLCTKCLLLCLF